MAKQIKVIKCPQCGNTKPTPIGNDHYRCDKCGTEFFLDNDDINVNIKHQYETKEKNTDVEKNIKKVSIIVIISVCFLFFAMFIRTCSNMFRSTSRTSSIYSAVNKNEYKERYNATLLLPIENKAVLFYQTNRNYIHRDGPNVNLFVFRDVKTGKIIKEYKDNIKRDSYYTIKGRSFESDSAYYFTIGDRLIYKLRPNKYEFEDVTEFICSRKPALNTGLSAVYILNSTQGDGFRLVTNLGKEFYYFPKTNSLYTEKAFKYIADGGMETLTPQATDKIYYLFEKGESKSSNSVIRIMEVKYKFNNGDPQNLTRYMSSYVLANLKNYRITSCNFITDEFIAFEPRMLYYDNSYMLISFNATMAKDTPSKVQLLTTKGEVLWTVTFNFELKCLGATRTNSGYMLQTKNDEFYEISLDGQTNTKYYFPETNK